MNLLDFMILSLATWRLSSLLVSEDGPFYVFVRLRTMVGVYPSQSYGDGFFGSLLSCVWCLSVWIGLGVVAGWYFYPIVTFWACLPLALSAAAIIVERMVSDG